MDKEAASPFGRAASLSPKQNGGEIPDRLNE
jgi:hypothetical protein